MCRVESISVKAGQIHPIAEQPHPPFWGQVPFDHQVKVLLALDQLGIGETRRDRLQP